MGIRLDHKWAEIMRFERIQARRLDGLEILILDFHRGKASIRSLLKTACKKEPGGMPDSI
jgi:hypothetical protein